MISNNSELHLSSQINELIENSTYYDRFFDKFLINLTVLVFLSFVSVITLLGNLLVIIAVISTKSLHTVTNSFIVSLAVADMLVPLFIEPLSIFMFIFKKWTLGSMVCDLWIWTDVMLCTASILNLCCISLDRYFAITQPLAYTQFRSPKLARTMIALVWVTSIIISSPPVFGWRDQKRYENTCHLNLLLSYRIYSSMGSFFIPCIIMIFVYIRIFIVIHNREKYLKNNSSYLRNSIQERDSLKKNLRSKNKSMKNRCDGSNSKSVFKRYDLNAKELVTDTEEKERLDALPKAFKNGSIEVESKHLDQDKKCRNTDLPELSFGRSNSDAIALNEYSSMRIKKSNNRQFSIWSFGAGKKNKSPEQLKIAKESKAAKKLAIVVGTFILCWLPFFIVYVLEAVLPKKTIDPDLVNSITWLGYCNSAINPIIYAFLSIPFRKAFYRITFGKFKSKDNFIVTKTVK